MQKRPLSPSNGRYLAIHPRRTCHERGCNPIIKSAKSLFLERSKGIPDILLRISSREIYRPQKGFYPNNPYLRVVPTPIERAGTEYIEKAFISVLSSLFQTSHL